MFSGSEYAPSSSCSKCHGSGCSVQHTKAFTKDEYRQMATADLGAFSKAAFDYGWIAAIEDSGRQDWYEPLSRRRMAPQ
jgi:hypothetical protein